MIQTENVWLTTGGTSRIGMDGSNLAIHTTGTFKIDNTDTLNVQGNLYVTHALSSQGGTEIAYSTISENQNNWSVAGISPSKSIHSFIFANATVSLKVTGLDTTGFEVGKVVTIRNNTDTTLSTSSLILLEVDSASSDAANRFYISDVEHPIMLMPQENIDFIFDGEQLQYLSGTRGYDTGKSALFDFYMSPHVDYMSNESTFSYKQYNYASHFHAPFGTSKYSLLRCLVAGNGANTSGYSMQGAWRQAGSLGNSSVGFCFLHVAVERKAEAANDYSAYVGLTVGYSRRDPTTNVPLAICSWAHERVANADYWITKTARLNTSTEFSTSVPVTAKTLGLHLGGFVNGDATRVDWFYSTDYGNTWNFTTNSHVTNIPRMFSGNTNACCGPNMYIAKQTGLLYQKLWTGGGGQIGGSA